MLQSVCVFKHEIVDIMSDGDIMLVVVNDIVDDGGGGGYSAGDVSGNRLN